MYQNELYHHGIKGQKWGVRRYQNSDGSYTKAGRKRYGMDLDINDKSRKNVAKIRTGEAKRRLDMAKANNKTNYTRIADLQGRVRSAKRNERQVKRIDKGSKLAAKGQTINSNKMKGFSAHLAARVGSKFLTSYLNMRQKDLMAKGKWTGGHQYVARMVNKYGSYGMQGLALTYNIKKSRDNANLRAYNAAKWTNGTSLKSIGSSEYADVVKRSKK